MDDYVRRLETFLQSENPWSRHPRLMVGHSFGGMLALSWLLSHTADPAPPIAGLVLVACSAGPLFERVRLRLGRAFGREWRLGLAPWLQLWNRPSVTWMVKVLTSGFRSHVGRVDFGALARPSDLAMDLAGWRNTDWRAMRSYRLALSGFDIRHRLREITIPTIVLHGSRDSLFSVEVAEELAAGLPSAELRIVDGAGHGLPLTHGEYVVRAVRDVWEGSGEQGAGSGEQGAGSRERGAGGVKGEA